PPTLTSPTSLAYWLPAGRAVDHPAPRAIIAHVAGNDSIPAPAPPPVALPASPPPSRPWGPVIAFCIWAGGVCLLGLWLARRALGVTRLIRRSEPASASLQAILKDCCAKLPTRGDVQLRLSSEIDGPAACGWWRPAILIPTRLGQGLTEAQWRSVLLHELAHIRRGDLWVHHLQ